MQVGAVRSTPVGRHSEPARKALKFPQQMPADEFRGMNKSRKSRKKC